MKVLSLFDGISCAREALSRELFDISEYYASEIDPHAIKISQRMWPTIKHIGDIKSINATSFPFLFDGSVDLLIGGSPCQDLSIAKKQRKGLKGNKSSLFWDYVRVLKEVKPKYFILENVASMPKEALAVITKTLGVEPIMIDAQLVSAQMRRRLFWTNIPDVQLPEDRGIYLMDILEGGYTERDKSFCIDANYFKGTNPEYYFNKAKRQIVWRDVEAYQYRRTYWRECKTKGKCPTLTANMGTGGNNVPYIGAGEPYRKLTVKECERLQSLPDCYTEGVSNTQRYKAIGNAFNVEVVRHILKNIKKAS